MLPRFLEGGVWGTKSFTVSACYIILMEHYINNDAAGVNPHAVKVPVSAT
jgi:hypothetical protein